jgi:hypothetical protein
MIHAVHTARFGMQAAAKPTTSRPVDSSSVSGFSIRPLWAKETSEKIDQLLGNNPNLKAIDEQLQAQQGDNLKQAVQAIEDPALRQSLGELNQLRLNLAILGAQIHGAMAGGVGNKTLERYHIVASVLEPVEAGKANPSSKLDVRG